MTRGAARLSVALATATKNEVLRRYLEERMDKPRIFLGSSGKQANLLLALTRGLEDIAHVDPWTTSFNPGTTTLERLLELTHEVDFAAFVFAQDDWTTNNPQGSPAPGAGQASPRDNVVFEAGLFGGTLGMRRTFILHASGAKLPSDLSGLTCVRYGEATTEDEIKVINEKLRKAIENEGHVARIEGLWWQFSLTERTAREPSAVSLLKISRDRAGALEVAGRSWQEDGRLSARYWSEAVKERKEPSGVFYYWNGERPLNPNAPRLYGTGEIRMESAERASGYFTTRADTHPKVDTRTSGVYWRAAAEDLSVMDGREEGKRAELIAERLQHWKSIKNA
jgi:predicted nucleotide-binding protein